MPIDSRKPADPAARLSGGEPVFEPNPTTRAKLRIHQDRYRAKGLELLPEGEYYRIVDANGVQIWRCTGLYVVNAIITTIEYLDAQRATEAGGAR